MEISPAENQLTIVEEPENDKPEPSDEPLVETWRCPICEAESSGHDAICGRCRSLVDLGRADEISQHDGADRKVWLESIEKLSLEGSSFERCIGLALAHLNLKNSHEAVALLQAASELWPESEAVASGFSRLKRRPLVMVIEDSEPIRKLVTGALERHLFRVFSASDALRVLDAVANDLPGVFVVDADLGGMSG